MRARRAARIVTAAALVCSLSCGGRLLRQYEYEEEIFLDLDGSAIIIVNTSVAALVALRGVDLDIDPRARFDRADVRDLYESDVAAVTRVSRPWRRDGRRFFQVRLEVDDVRRLSKVPLFAWSTYRLERQGEELIYRQTIEAAANRPVGDVGWDGNELVGFRLHLPSKIFFHNAPSKAVERGNILSWEQSLSDRLAGAPIQMEVRMDTASILSQTLWLFTGAFAAALLVLAALILWTVRSGRERT